MRKFLFPISLISLDVPDSRHVALKRPSTISGVKLKNVQEAIGVTYRNELHGEYGLHPGLVPHSVARLRYSPLLPCPSLAAIQYSSSS